MATLTSSLIVALIDRVSAPARAAASSIKGIAAAAAAANGGGLAAMARANSEALSAMHGKMLAAIAVAYGLREALSSPLGVASRFESILLDIAQKSDLSDSAMKTLGERIRSIAPIVNKTAQEVAAGMDVLTSMGLDPTRALAISPVLGKAASAYKAEMSDVARMTFAAIENLKVPVSETAKLLDVLSQASKEGAFEFKDMAREFPAIAAAAQALGQKGVIGAARIAAALETIRKGSGSSAEAATNLQNVFQKISSPETTKNFAKFGIDIRKELKKTMDEGGDVLEMLAGNTMKALGGDLTKLGDLFQDKQVQEGLRAFIQNWAEYRRIRKSALDATGVVDVDFDRRMKTFEAQVESFKIQVSDLGITIGGILMPHVNRLLGVIRPVVSSFKEFSEAHPALIGNLIKGASAVIGLTVAAHAARWAFLWLRGGVIMLAKPLLAAGVAMSTFVASMATAAFARVVASLASLRRALLSIMVLGAVGGPAAAFRAMGVAMLGLLSPIGLVTGALRLLKLAVIGTGIGAILVAIAAAGLFIYENWSGLGAFFTAFGSAFMAALGPLAPAIEPLIGGVKWLWDTVSGFFGEISPATWTAWGTQAGAAVGAVAAAVLNLPSKIVSLGTDLYNGALTWMGRMLDGAVAGFVHIAEFLASIPRKFFELGGPAGIAMYDAGVAALQGLWDGMKAKMSELMGWLGGIADSVAGVFSGIPGKIKSAFGFKQPTDAGALDGKTPRQRERVYRALGGLVESVPDVNRETAGHDPRRTGEAVPTGRRPRSESLRVIGVNPEDRDAMPEFAPTLTPTVDKTALVDLDKTVADVAAAMSGLSTTTAKPQVDPAPLMGLLDIINKINAGLSAISSSAGPVAATAGSKLQAGGGVARLGRAALSDYGSETGGI